MKMKIKNSLMVSGYLTWLYLKQKLGTTRANIVKNLKNINCLLWMLKEKRFKILIRSRKSYVYFYYSVRVGPSLKSWIMMKKKKNTNFYLIYTTPAFQLHS